jgi:hypothetical protein
MLSIYDASAMKEKCGRRRATATHHAVCLLGGFDVQPTMVHNHHIRLTEGFATTLVDKRYSKQWRIVEPILQAATDEWLNALWQSAIAQYYVE